jgi:hypothetical protein
LIASRERRGFDELAWAKPLMREFLKNRAAAQVRIN